MLWAATAAEREWDAEFHDLGPTPTGPPRLVGRPDLNEAGCQTGNRQFLLVGRAV